MTTSKENTFSQNKKLFDGKWNDNLSWEFYLSEKLPDETLCTAVCCVTVLQNKLILIRNKRGWELPAGHVEMGESPLQSVSREVLEETGYSIQSPSLFGFKKVTAKVPVLKNPDLNSYYPFPHSYVGFFFAEVLATERQKLSSDVYELKIADYQEAIAMLSIAKQYDAIIDYLVLQRLIQLN